MAFQAGNRGSMRLFKLQSKGNLLPSAKSISEVARRKKIVSHQRNCSFLLHRNERLFNTSDSPTTTTTANFYNLRPTYMSTTQLSSLSSSSSSTNMSKPRIIKRYHSSLHHHFYIMQKEQELEDNIKSRLLKFKPDSLELDHIPTNVDEFLDYVAPNSNNLLTQKDFLFAILLSSTVGNTRLAHWVFTQALRDDRENFDVDSGRLPVFEDSRMIPHDTNSFLDLKEKTPFHSTAAYTTLMSTLAVHGEVHYMIYYIQQMKQLEIPRNSQIYTHLMDACHKNYFQNFSAKDVGLDVIFKDTLRYCEEEELTSLDFYISALFYLSQRSNRTKDFDDLLHIVMDQPNFKPTPLFNAARFYNHLVTRDVEGMFRFYEVCQKTPDQVYTPLTYYVLACGAEILGNYALSREFLRKISYDDLLIFDQKATSWLSRVTNTKHPKPYKFSIASYSAQRSSQVGQSPTKPILHSAPLPLSTPSLSLLDENQIASSTSTDEYPSLTKASEMLVKSFVPNEIEVEILKEQMNNLRRRGQHEENNAPSYNYLEDESR